MLAPTSETRAPVPATPSHQETPSSRDHLYQMLGSLARAAGNVRLQRENACPPGSPPERGLLGCTRCHRSPGKELKGRFLCLEVTQFGGGVLL